MVQKVSNKIQDMR